MLIMMILVSPRSCCLRHALFLLRYFVAILVDAHLAHELLFLKPKLLLPVFDCHSHFIFADNHLRDALVAFACHSVRC